MNLKRYVNGEYVDLTPEEIEELNRSNQQAEAQEAHRPLGQSEVFQIIARQLVNTMDIPDHTALRMKDYYPAFSDIIGQSVKQGYKFTHGGKLYKVAQPDMTIQEHYPPGPGTESLYTRIDEEHLGNLYDPIPYEGNMILEEGKHYSQDGVLYLCTRGTGNAVHQPLAELVSFVEAVEWPSFF